MFDRRLWPYIDWVLIALVAVICVFGFATVYSASVSYANGNSFFPRQLLWFLAGLAVLAFTTAFDYKILGQVSLWLHLLVIGLLVLTLLYGTGGPGSKVERWLKLGPFFLQPSEFAKYTLVLYLAHYFRESRRVGEIGVKELAWPLLVTVIPFVLILKQPDLGTAGVVLVVFVPVIFLVGLRFRVIAVIMGLAAAFAPFIWAYGLKPYQKHRILTMIDPDADPLGKGYHIIQSKIAVGSGGIWGKGFLEGTQAHLNFLPARHTDFAFSVFAEEWGFVGTSTLVILYIFLTLWCLKDIGKTKDRSGTILVLGVTSSLAAQILINLGMVIGLLPVVGMPLPFVSYGGSAMISHMIGIGLIVNVRMRQADGAATNPSFS
ncbi:MAG: rod shape-determining protein RodA [Candidatus Lambdaproteobacteria bacterium RIFOXYD1_FULL_56_27]|uniref:Peptidoglycan glycosyltransferase MrdB n=1 Tax=Candidatus Lambdaproteobacteria bacterium RIFOXYD2_FULL_56_26 TaxID=1817773 RepID=A0A1F6GR00_9PROT|nr:MAG: rod shape-determining protein RodA [Candidatus Lambdaproteobacteria bacterium RIFOXYD2_FULL_56_26]OGH05437.1 MAG: rod shape-determining protein RodA [Candidatus Lambdaproteobacteria bacterium RIFOXYC1_FULL_56_13]OGH06949.1 MAG: rod shape-determining protein RodA [Candidatus Lambdaproteobacteria bacterium RIFOXYD1_FULL_56_27]